MFFKSIRARLQIWYGLILVIILAGFGFTAWELERGHLLGRVNSELDRRSHFLANAIHHGPNHRGRSEPEPDDGGLDPGEPPLDRPPPGQFPDEGPPDGPPGLRSGLPLPPETAGLFDAGDPNDFYFIIYDPEGGEISRSTNAPPASAERVVPSVNVPAAPGRGQPPVPVHLLGDRAETDLRLPLGGVIRTGCSIAPELKELRGAAFKLLGAGGLILLLGLTGGWWLTSRALQPIADISATAARISTGDLSQRISLADAESELGRLALVLNSTFARLEAAFTQQQQFTSDAAHELRTPVSVILTQTQMALGRERSPAEYRETVEACQRAAQRMRRLIESLLALARLDAGQEPMKRLNFDLAGLIRDCSDLVRPLAAARGITVSLDLPPLACAGDPERMAQVLTNLLTNAIQYNRPGGAVQVSASREGGFATVTVRDTGAGIAPADLPRVFERFYRADKSRSAGGSGLGLAICQAIIDAHGGSIAAASEPGIGTTFTFRLPVTV